MCPATTVLSHLPCSGMGVCMRRLSSAFTSLSLACNRLRMVCLSTVNIRLLLFFAQMCVKPRKSNVSGFPWPRRARFSAANGPNFQEAGLFRVQLQPELAQSLAEFLPEPLGIRPVLESEHAIISIADDNHVAARL